MACFRCQINENRESCLELMEQALVILIAVEIVLSIVGFARDCS